MVVVVALCCIVLRDITDRGYPFAFFVFLARFGACWENKCVFLSWLPVCLPRNGDVCCSLCFSRVSTLPCPTYVRTSSLQVSEVAEGVLRVSSAAGIQTDRPRPTSHLSLMTSRGGEGKRRERKIGGPVRSGRGSPRKTQHARHFARCGVLWCNWGMPVISGASYTAQLGHPPPSPRGDTRCGFSLAGWLALRGRGGVPLETRVLDADLGVAMGVV